MSAGGGGGGLLPFRPLPGRPSCRGSPRVRPVEEGGDALLGSSCCLSCPVPLPRQQARCTHTARTITCSLVVRTVLLPCGGSCLVSLTSVVSRAYCLLCLTYWMRYIPGWRRLLMKCEQRGGLTVRLEGFLCHPPPLSRGGPLSRHHTARGGLTTHPFPGACVSTSTHPDTGAVVSVCGKWKLRSGRALSPPGPLPPPSAMKAPEVLWQWRGATDGGFIVASRGHLVSLHSQCRRGPAGWRRWCPSPLRAVSDSRGHIFRRGSSGWRHWRPPPLRARAPTGSHWPNGWRRWVTSPTASAGACTGLSAAGSHIHECVCMTSKLHDTLRGKPTSPLSTLLLLPSASSPSAGPPWCPPFCGRLCPALLALSRLSACSSCRLSLFPFCPAPSLARCTTLYHVLSPVCETAPTGPCPLPRRAQPLALHLHEPAPGAPPIFVGS